MIGGDLHESIQEVLFGWPVPGPVIGAHTADEITAALLAGPLAPLIAERDRWRLTATLLDAKLDAANAALNAQ
jgi:hypothetical protein